MDLVEVELARVVIQQKLDNQYLLLKQKQGSRGFQMVVGFYEAEEIRRKLAGEVPVRPLTHDLVGRVIRATGHRLGRVVVTELRDATFYANLVLVPAAAPPDQSSGEQHVDCRPSDAIALAVQTGCRMFVAREVFEAVANP